MSSPPHLSNDAVCYDKACRASQIVCADCYRCCVEVEHYNRHLCNLLSEAVVMLNNLPADLVPLEVLDCTNESVKRGGRQPDTDFGNYAGSMLVLALCRPKVFGFPMAPPLRLLGYPPAASLLRISSRPPVSGRGVDNMRTNILERFMCVLEDAADRCDAAKEALQLLRGIWCQYNTFARMIGRDAGHEFTFTQTVPLWWAARHVLAL